MKDELERGGGLKEEIKCSWVNARCVLFKE